MKARELNTKLQAPNIEKVNLLSHSYDIRVTPFLFREILLSIMSFEATECLVRLDERILHSVRLSLHEKSIGSFLDCL